MFSQTLEKFLKLSGRKVAAARHAQDLTQRETANEAHMSSRYLQSIEAGQINMTLSTLLRLARPLHVSPAELLPSTSEWKWNRRIGAE